jgi:hypothetical protein
MINFFGVFQGISVKLRSLMGPIPSIVEEPSDLVEVHYRWI